MNLSKIVIAVFCGVLAFSAAVFGILYLGEIEKNRILRAENTKTADESKQELARLKDEEKRERDSDIEEKRKLLEQVGALSREKESAAREAGDLKKRFLDERKMSLTAGGDMDKLRSEVAVVRRENKESIARLEESFTKKKQDYEARILSLEAQLAKSKQRFHSEAERYHYNLGVIHTQNKDFESAVSELKTALGYNPKSARAHYNLGIIYDDYFKDREAARYHYRSFLELEPASDDAEAVREWVKGLDK